MALNSMVSSGQRSSRPDGAQGGQVFPRTVASTTRRRHDTQLDRDTMPNIEPDSPETNPSFFPFPSITNWYAQMNKRHAATVILLCYINLINYMDRSTVAGVLVRIEQDEDFNIKGDKSLGLLQTSFVFSYMLFAPVFGYMGDRYNRRYILCFGLTLWLLSTLIGSFMHNFWWFLFFRAVVGIGEASYSTIAPAIISDMFSKDTRSMILALFYFAIPVGTGLGYILGAEIASHHDWRWSLRVTPLLGFFSVICILIFMQDPQRGESEGAQNRLRPTAPKEDMKALAKNKSFVVSCIAFTCITFSVGALMLWGPKFAFYGAKAHCGSKAGCQNITEEGIAYKFGIVMFYAGVIGVPLGSFISQRLRSQIPNADPIISGTTLLISVPILFFGFLSARWNTNLCYLLTFVAGLLLNCNWSIVSDMTLYVVIPTRRSIASATQILVSHALGDAISPFLIGVVADAIRPLLISPSEYTSVSLAHSETKNLTPKEYDVEFRCLQYALFSSCFFQAFGAFFFYMMSFSILEDKRNADRAIHGEDNEFADDQPILAREIREIRADRSSDTDNQNED